MMADRGAAIGAGAGPVSASRLEWFTRQRCAVQLRAGQDIVAIGIVSSSVDYVALFGKRCLLAEIVLVTVEIGHVFRNPDPFGVIPGALPDAVAGMDSRLAAGCDTAEVGVPGPVAGPRSAGQ